MSLLNDLTGADPALRPACRWSPPRRHRGARRRHDWGLRLCGRLALSGGPDPGADRRPLRAGEWPPSGLSAQPRQRALPRRALREQRPGRACVDGVALHCGTGHARHRPHRAGGRPALRGGRGHDGAQPRAAFPPSRRRGMAHRQQRYPGFPGPQPGGVLCAASRRQARSGHGQARSRGAQGVLRRASRERESGFPDQGADDHLRLCRRHLPKPERLPLHRRGQDPDAGALGVRAGTGCDGGEPGPEGSRGQERSVRRLRLCRPPGARAVASRRHPGAARRPHSGCDASLAGRAAEPGRRDRDRRGHAAGSGRQLPRRQFRSSRPAPAASWDRTIRCSAPVRRPIRNPSRAAPANRKRRAPSRTRQHREPDCEPHRALQPAGQAAALDHGGHDPRHAVHRRGDGDLAGALPHPGRAAPPTRDRHPGPRAAAPAQPLAPSSARPAVGPSGLAAAGGSCLARLALWIDARSAAGRLGDAVGGRLSDRGSSAPSSCRRSCRAIQFSMRGSVRFTHSSPTPCSVSSSLISARP